MTRSRIGGGPVGMLVAGPAGLLVCFAVREEARFFSPPSCSKIMPCQVWITGMGRRNALEGIRQACDAIQPRRVITCGFAGGLNPDLPVGTVIFDQDFDAGFGENLTRLGAVKATFYCSKRVAVTAAEKHALWKTTNADVVEMESSVIRSVCRELKIPSATVRVISDSADQDLPLDFNALMTSDDRINYFKLAGTILAAPRRISKLIEFQRQTILAAQSLGRLMEELLRARCD